MKRKFILLPITLTAFVPAISLVGCACNNNDEPEPRQINLNQLSTKYETKIYSEDFSVHKNEQICFVCDLTLLADYVGEQKHFHFNCTGGEGDWDLLSLTMNNDVFKIVQSKTADDQTCWQNWKESKRERICYNAWGNDSKSNKRTQCEFLVKYNQDIDDAWASFGWTNFLQ